MSSVGEKRKNGFISIRTKLTIVIALLVVLAIAAVELYSYETRVSTIETTVKDEQLNAAVLTAVRLETEIARTVAVLETAANNPVFSSDDKDALVQTLLAVKEQNPIFSTVFMTDSALEKLNEKGEGGSLATREYMQEVQKSKKTVVSHEILISQATQKPSLMIAAPVKAAGAPERYLGISVNIDNLQEIVAAGKKNDDNYSFAFDGKNGLVFAHPVREYVGTLKIANPDEKDEATVAPELKAMAKEAAAGRSGSQIYTFNGSKIIAAYTNIPGTSLGVATRMTYDEAMQPVKQERNMAILVTLIAAAFSAVIAWVSAKYIADPIKRIAHQANTIAAGDFTRAETIEVKGRDEITGLQQNFKDMALMLRSTMEQIEMAAAQIATASEELEASAAQSAQASSQIAVTVSQVATGAMTQTKAVKDTVQAGQGISKEITDIAQNAAAVEQVSQVSASAAKAGGDALNQAIDSIANINGIVQETAGAINNLGTSSAKISQIITTITGIASQTNLLALNAAIEAARAGEHGRGFAVVADEVRKLAEQAEESAGSIARIIDEVQFQIGAAIESMDRSAQEVHKGQEVVLAAGKSFTTIQQQIEDVYQKVQGITGSVQVLAVSSSTVVKAMETVRDISEETAAGSQTISASTEEQSAGMQEIASSAEALAELSGQLQAALKHYKF